MISQKPYLIRGLYEWCNDNSFTPHLVTFVDKNTLVPLNYVKNDQIVLNIAFNAVKDLLIENDWITFKATFGGTQQQIAIPVANVIALFAKETGQGMQFELENYTPKDPDPEPSKPTGGLTLVK